MRRFATLKPYARPFSSTVTWYAWTTWNPQFSQAVTPGAYPVAPIPIDVAPLLKYTKYERAMFVHGSPGCGKSSLAHQIAQAAVSLGYYNEVCVPNPNGTDGAMVSAKTQALKASGGNARCTCLFIVDDAHDQLEKQVIHPDFMYKAGYHVMYFGTTAPPPRSSASSSEVWRHKHWMFAPSVDRQVVRDFAARVLEYHGADPKVASGIVEQAFDYVGGSMGMLMNLLQAIVDGRGKFPTPNDLLSKYQPGVVVDKNSAWEKYPSTIALAKQILAVGEVTPNPEIWDRSMKGWQHRGVIGPRRDVDSDKAKGIIPLAWHSVSVGWVHSWQATYCRIRKPAIKPHPTEWVPQAKLQAPIDVVLRLLPSFDIESLVPNVVNGVPSLNAAECDFPAELYGAVKRMIPEAAVHNEAKAKSTSGKRGRLDFILLLEHWSMIGQGRWGFELIVRGKGEALNEGACRFAKSGKYNNIAWDDYLLLDCHTEPLGRKDAINSEKVATISPHRAEGWNMIVLDHRGKRVNIPRDGVPRYVTEWSAKAPKAQVAVKLLGPGYNVVVHFGAALRDMPVRVPERTDADWITCSADLKSWLVKNVEELRGKMAKLVVCTTASQAHVMQDDEPLVGPMTKDDPKKTHYHVFIK